MRAPAASAGVNQPLLSQVEHGRSAPSMATVYRLAEALHVAPGDLLPSASPSGIEVVRAGEGRLIPVSESPDAAVGRVMAGGRLEVIEYGVAPASTWKSGSPPAARPASTCRRAGWTSSSRAATRFTDK